MPSKIDGALEATGAYGGFQWVQVFFSGYGYLASAFHFLAIVFHGITPPYRCAIDVWGNDSYAPFNAEHNQSIHQWIPIDKNGDLDSCIIYASNSTNNTVECAHHVYDHSEYWGNSLNMEFDLVCVEGESVATTVKVIYTLGLVVGAFVVGVIGDRFGRRPTLIGCMMTGGMLGVVASFSVHIIMFAALRFIIAGCFVGALLISHIITMESVGPSRRAHAIAFRSFFFPCGTMLTSLFAYYIQDWNWFQLAISIPAIVGGLFMIAFLKETPHFLLTKGKHEEAEELFKYIAKMNGTTVPDDMMDGLKEDEQSAVSEKLKSILQAPVLLRRTAMFLYLWFIAGLGFYGLNFNVSNLIGDVFVNNAISGAAELPTVPLALLSQKLGRKPPITASLFIGSVSLIASAVMTIYLDPNKYGYAMIIAYMVGKAGIATVFLFDYFWCSEMFPSTLRTTLVGLCSLASRVAMILTPVIADLSTSIDTIFGAGLAALIFGITMFIGGVISTALPETNQRKMPETIAEANLFMTKRNSEAPADDKKFNDFSSQVDLFQSDSTTKL